MEKIKYMKKYCFILGITTLLLLSGTSMAEKYKGTKSGNVIKQTAAGCQEGVNFKWLDINNVRTRINTSGDMWWDFSSAQYEVPKGSGKMSMFAAALWIGGKDVNGNLKLAAQRFRQVGIDFFPGPLSTDNKAEITPDQCVKWDKLFKITRAEVDKFVAWKNDPSIDPNYTIPQSIRDYPAHGNVALQQSKFLAPFYDVDNDLIYNPDNGDYPYYDLTNKLCGTHELTMEGNGNLVDQVLKGDGTLWWVFNDKGNIHSESGGQPIGLEIRAQAFAFTTGDEINNMTFYSYEIINRSTYQLTNTFFSQWVDTDLGFADDDFVGCDVVRGLGFAYNGKKDFDGTGQLWAYGPNPPAIGVDFFQGPYMDPDGYDNPGFGKKHNFGPSFYGARKCDIVRKDGDTIKMYNPHPDVQDSVMVRVDAAAINGVNFGNGVVDDERFGMRRFVYHNNSSDIWPTQDPHYAKDYYNFLTGIWKDDKPMQYGGNGHPDVGGIGPECYFMFPDLTDECNWGTKGVVLPDNVKKWTEVTAGNLPGDRRFMHSAGPFTLKPGAVNYITVGIPWARAASGDALESVKLLKIADDKCQQLFDNCFKVIEGPRAPDLVIKELDKKLIIQITNSPINDASNNYKEMYQEYDPRIQSPADSIHWDSLYRFEGYKIYQLKDATVSAADLYDITKAKLIFHCDVKNNIGRIKNFIFDGNLGENVPREEVPEDQMTNTGIVHTFVVTKDFFQDENAKNDFLVNNKQYYFMAVAYGYNNYKTYLPDVSVDGQKQPYLAGRKNVKSYTAIPNAQAGPYKMNSTYGSGLIITRVAGQGNGGNFLELSDESVNEILSKKIADEVNVVNGSDDYPIAYNLTYKQGRGPVKVKVVDPLNVKDSKYAIQFDSMYNITVPAGDSSTVIKTANWKLIDLNSNKVWNSDNAIHLFSEQLFANEQYLIELGFSISFEQPHYPGPYWVGGAAGKEQTYPLLPNNGFLGATMKYSDPSKNYFAFLKDEDSEPKYNWIRSGLTSDDAGGKAHPDDPEQAYENVLGGTWAPYKLVSKDELNVSIAQTPPSGGQGDLDSRFIAKFTELSSVDIVFTSDKSKWTRSAVIEQSLDKGEGKAKRFELRKGRSVNQNGDTAVISSDPALNSDFISPYGMGWFPGYAINVETGERLNIVFGENSEWADENGRDMLFNPTPNKAKWGGKHFIYIMGHNANKRHLLSNNYQNPALPDDIFYSSAYDGCAQFVKVITRTYPISVRKFAPTAIYSHFMWASVPIQNVDPVTKKPIELFTNDLKIQLRVTKPYDRYFAVPLSGAKNVNNYWPQYEFDTKVVATGLNDVTKAESDLDLIRVVPNPYYSFSKYDVDQNDTRVKIVNLPPDPCTVSIYSLNGTLIKQISHAGYDPRTFTTGKDDRERTYVIWDLKNTAGIPIAGGVYLIHVKTPHGEKVLKWFGSLRPFEPNGF